MPSRPAAAADNSGYRGYSVIDSGGSSPLVVSPPRTISGRLVSACSGMLRTIRSSKGIKQPKGPASGRPVIAIGASDSLQ